MLGVIVIVAFWCYVLAGLYWSEVVRGRETERAGRRLIWMVIVPLGLAYLLKRLPG